MKKLFMMYIVNYPILQVIYINLLFKSIYIQNNI